MHALTDLKRYFEKHNITIVEFNGWQLVTEDLGTWGLAFDEFRQDGVIKTRKEIDALIGSRA